MDKPGGSRLLTHAATAILIRVRVAVHKAGARINKGGGASITGGEFTRVGGRGRAVVGMEHNLHGVGAHAV